MHHQFIRQSIIGKNRCQECGAPIPEKYTLCPECGERLFPPEEEQENPYEEIPDEFDAIDAW